MRCLLWNSTPSSRQDARERRGNGGRRVSLETISPPTRSGPTCPHYLCQWARRLSSVKLAVILWRSICGEYQVPGTRYLKLYLKWLDTRYQIYKIYIWYHGIYFEVCFWGGDWVGWVGLGLTICFLYSVRRNVILRILLLLIFLSYSSSSIYLFILATLMQKLELQ